MKKEKLRSGGKYMLRINEAAEYFGLGEKKLRHLAEEGQNIFSVKMDNRWMFNRKKFEKYIETYYFSGEQIPDEEIPVKLFKRGTSCSTRPKCESTPPRII